MSASNECFTADLLLETVRDGHAAVEKLCKNRIPPNSVPPTHEQKIEKLIEVVEKTLRVLLAGLDKAKKDGETVGGGAAKNLADMQSSLQPSRPEEG